VGAI